MPNYAKIFKPLTNLMDITERNEVALGESQEAAFNTRKQKLSSHFCSEHLPKRNLFFKNRHLGH
ncbi:hypothetical protein HPB48_009852 [Haemaphysalis longicornis]|uniref:Uncharacterized protein n=1 Tax=Haemaphysalis longicornis TaxID=44386 RepID=A0A9J6GJQ2_HAELO|nr:hypothetical protein HPB48_009852 [Haemaphysalis longicornis]